MAQALKCPNPGCPYLFDPSIVPTGVVLACPQCGTHFTLAPPAPPNPPDPIPEPLNPALTAPAPDRPPSGEPLPPTPRRGGWSALLLPALAGLLIAGTLGAGIYFVVRGGRPVRDDDVSSPLRGLNLSFTPPDTPWVPDEEMVAKLGTFQFVYKHAEADAWMAFAARDFITRHPRPGELAGGVRKPLERLYENLREEERPADARWLGLAASTAVAYRGQVRDGVEARAVGYAVGSKGVGYWALYWAAARDFDTHRAAFDATRERCRLLGLRDDWQPKGAAVRTFLGEKADYKLIDAGGVWERPKDVRPVDEDEHADLYLVAREQVGTKTRGAEGTLLVYLLDPTGADPLDVARRYVEQRRTAEVRRGDPKFTPTFNELTGDPAGDPVQTDLVPTAGVLRLESRLKGAESQDRLIVISAIAAAGKVVAVHTTCELRHRSLYEPTFVQIAGSLRGK